MEIVHLPFELWNIIFDYLTLKTQIKSTQTCKILNESIHVTDLYHINENIKKRLTGEVIKKYPYLNKLDASGEDCSISDEDLVGLN